MSEVMLNIIETNQAIHGRIHGSVADALVAALSAEPETINELEAALQRFIKPVDNYRPFSSFFEGTKEEAWDAGIVTIDLKARVVAVQSSYSAPEAKGEILYHDGTTATDVPLIYRLPDDWLFVYSLDEYRSARDQRSVQRTENSPLEVRQVLYGPAMIEFIVSECAGALASFPPAKAEKGGAVESSIDLQCEVGNPQCADPRFDEAIAEIHAKWLMAPRADLVAQTPREVMLSKLDFIDFDLHARELQWSMLCEGPPALARDSFAYRFAGFGTHEYVLYYDLMRHLLSECLQRVRREGRVDVSAESLRLNKVKEDWLNEPQNDLEGRTPTAIIESERRRIPLVMSARSMIIDENCELCQMLAREMGDEFQPGFWHLDGSNMDERFEFSFHRTPEEWEEEERQRKEFNEEFCRNWAKEHGIGA